MKTRVCQLNQLVGLCSKTEQLAPNKEHKPLPPFVSGAQVQNKVLLTVCVVEIYGLKLRCVQSKVKYNEHKFRKD